MQNTAGYAAPPVMFVAGDDAAQARSDGLVTDVGFHPVDAGDLRVARSLEPCGILWIHMGLDRKTGRDNAFAYLARGKDPRS
jgi:predicted dinucleotide-binding enzyme